MNQMSRLFKLLLTAGIITVTILSAASCRQTSSVGSVRSTRGNTQQTAAAEPALSAVCNAPGGIRIDWQNTDGAASYRVLRLAEDGSWQTAGDTAELYYIDRDVVSGNRYTYTVAALSADGSFFGEYDKTGLTFTYTYNYDAYAAAVPMSFTKQDIFAAGEKIGMDEYEIKAVVGWQEYECDRFFGDQYLAYLAACAKVNVILDGEYGRSREFTDYLESLGTEFSPNAQKSRYENASQAALTAVYIALNNLQPGIHFCQGADSKPEGCFYDPGIVIKGQNVYVW